MAFCGAPVDVLIRKLESNSQLTDGDRQALRVLPLTPRSLRADQDIVRQGDTPSQCCVVLEGWAYRYKITGAGKRQIVGLHPPGDTPDMQSLLVRTADHDIATLTPATIASIPHAALLDAIARFPNLAIIFWRDGLVDAAIFREWVVNIGQRRAPERIGHLICEMFTRLESIGLAHAIAERRSFGWPLTQQELADATGMSTVHVNRSLQDLRGRGLIETRNGTMAILDWPRLQETSEFVSDYLSFAKDG